MSDTETEKKPPFIPLLTLANLFFWTGLFSFGGGLSGWVHREIVVKRGWLESDDFMAGIALAQILPGANIANLCVYVGYRLRGGIGAVTILSSLLAGPTLVCILVATVYHHISEYPMLEASVDGVAAAAVGLNLRLGLAGAERFVPKIAPTVAMLATFLAIGIFEWPLVPVVLTVAPLSVAAVWPWKKNNA